MELRIKNSPECVVAAFCGSLDTVAAEQIEPQVKELEMLAEKPLTIDCTAMDYISSSGLRIMLRLRKSCIAHNNQVTLLNVNANIMEVLQVTHFNKIFLIKNS